MNTTDERPGPEAAIADALRAELARQWGAEFDNYIRDVDWLRMAHAALNTYRERHRPATDSGPVVEAARRLASQLAIDHTPERADVQGLCFLLDLMDRGWHPYGFELMAQRNKLFNALVDALQGMQDAGGEIDGETVQRITAVLDDVIDQAAQS